MCPHMVIKGSKVFRSVCNESHVPSDLVQFSVVLRFSRVRFLERVNLQSRPRVQCKIPALSDEGLLKIRPEARNEENRTRSSTWIVFLAVLCAGNVFGIPRAAEG